MGEIGVGVCLFLIFGWISGDHPEEYNLAKFQNMNVERSYLAPFHVVGNYIYIYIYIGIIFFKRIGNL